MKHKRLGIGIATILVYMLCAYVYFTFGKKDTTDTENELPNHISNIQIPEYNVSLGIQESLTAKPFIEALQQKELESAENVAKEYYETQCTYVKVKSISVCTKGERYEWSAFCDKFNPGYFIIFEVPAIRDGVEQNRYISLGRESKDSEWYVCSEGL